MFFHAVALGVRSRRRGAVALHTATGVVLNQQVVHVGTVLPALIGPMAVAHVGGRCASVRAGVDDLAKPRDLVGLVAQARGVVQAGRVVANPLPVHAHPPVALPKLHLQRQDVLRAAELALRAGQRARVNARRVLNPALHVLVVAALVVARRGVLIGRVKHKQMRHPVAVKVTVFLLADFQCLEAAARAPRQRQLAQRKLI